MWFKYEYPKKIDLLYADNYVLDTGIDSIIEKRPNNECRSEEIIEIGPNWTFEFYHFNEEDQKWEEQERLFKYSNDKLIIQFPDQFTKPADDDVKTKFRFKVNFKMSYSKSFFREDYSKWPFTMPCIVPEKYELERAFTMEIIFSNYQKGLESFEFPKSKEPMKI